METTKPLISVQNLQVDFHLPTHVVHAVREVNFDLHQGETLALVGGSGSGKSATAMSMLRLLPPMAKHPSGKILFKGEDVMLMDQTQLCQVRGNGIAMVFQEPMTALNPLHTIYAQIAESIFLHNPGITKTEAKKQVLQLLELVRLPRAKERMSAYPYELSGGQRQRVVIAMALANKPDVLIADEPTTALDVTVQQQILELLVQLQIQFKMGILFITHDLTVVQKIADRVCVMEDGKIVEQADVNTLFTSPQHPYTQALLKNKVEGMKAPREKTSPVLLKADNVNVRFVLKKSLFGRHKSTLEAVKNLSLSIRQGQTVGVVGESGSGKSTLGKAILQLLESEVMTVDSLKFDGESIVERSAYDMQQLRKHMQVVFQDPYGSLSPRMTVGNIVGEGLRVHDRKLPKNERMDRIRQALQDVKLCENMINRYPHECSGGQRQRIAIARAIILQPKFLCLDEPTSSLDRNIQVQIVDLLKDLQQKYHISYLFISHDLSVVQALCDEIIVMHNGEMIEQGSVEQIFEHPVQQYTKNLLHSALDNTRIRQRLLREN